MIYSGLKEECGVFGIYSNYSYEIAYDVQLGLFSLQHRGEESAGLAISYDNGIISHRDMGTVSQVFTESVLKELPKSNIAVGHVRYSTTGSSNVMNAQPVVLKGRIGEIALAHNGNIFNSSSLRNNLIKSKIMFQSTIDSEVIADLINHYYRGDIVEAINMVVADLKGSYAVVLMDKDKLIAVRDPNGIRPLVMGKKADGTVVIASESPALDVVDATFIRDIDPGEIVIVNDCGIQSYYIKGNHKKAVCSFEYVYFARNDSIMDGLNVYDARIKAGEILAKNYYVEADIVAPVPDSAAVSATAYANYTNIPYVDVLSKNRYVGRTFIQPKQFERENMVKIKLSAITENVKGKRIILIDDSIVRGTTMKKIVSLLNQSGAKEIHLRITSPQVKHSCYFGIDIQSSKELIATNHTNKEIAEILGCDSVEYLTVEELQKMCNNAKLPVCTGCFSGDYPIEVGTDKIDKLRME